MKQTFLLFALMGIFAITSKAASTFKIAGTVPSKYTIVYAPEAETEEGINMAQHLQQLLQQKTGVTLPIASADKVKKGTKTISFTHSKGIGVFNYAAKLQKGQLVIDGGGCWAMQKAAQIIAQQNTIPANYQLKGSVDGEFLFPRRTDVNLRILDDNIWDYSKDTLPPVWQKAGIDCRDDARAPEFAQLVRAYMPSVLTLQEYNYHMHVRFYPLIQKYNYEIAVFDTINPWPNTPIFYNKDELELLEARNILYTPAMWSNHASKSYTIAVLKQKSTGKTFAILNTHLWWKNEKAQPGSNFARASQVHLMMAEAEVIKAKYNCTLFVTGDMNCEEGTLPMQQFIQAGYAPCYKVATIYGNKDNGHHVCSPGELGVRTSHRKTANREGGAIDHCFIYNAQQGAEVKIFDCIQTFFTVKLTDHYPNLIDAKL